MDPTWLESPFNLLPVFHQKKVVRCESISSVIGVVDSFVTGSDFLKKETLIFKVFLLCSGMRVAENGEEFFSPNVLAPKLS